MDNIAVIIGTYGDLPTWQPFIDRAVKSVQRQIVPVDTVTSVHGPTLAAARNGGAFRKEEADWLVFLDADDELDENYIMYMLAGEGDIRQPSTLGIVKGIEDHFPVLIPPHPNGFMAGNHLTIGCMVRRKLFMDVGGFNDLPILEDWDLWIRLRLLGATLGACPDAIYRVHVSRDSRNHQNIHGHTYTDIQNKYQAEWLAKGLR